MKSKVYEQKFRERISAQEKIIDSFIEERELNYKYKFNVAKKKLTNISHL